MIKIKSSFELDLMYHAGQLLAQMFVQLHQIVIADITTQEIDCWIENYLKKNNLISSSKGYLGKYWHVSCISLNDEVVHGVPSSTTKLKNNDLVKIDVCASYKGYCADMARPFYIGQITESVDRLIKCASDALDLGIAQAEPGTRLTNISNAIQKHVESCGFGVVREFAGHGIGKKMHEDPEILNYGKAECGPIIRPGMAFAIEPMITFGDYKIYIASDGWTAKTVDKSLAAHVEDTVVITDSGPKIITRIN